MPIRITGLNSGLDTEAIISALVSSYSYKTNKYKKAQTKLSWKQDAWKTLNTKVYSFYTSLDSLRFSKNYNLKSTKVSDSTKATVTASSSAPNGTQKLNILKVAQAGYLTGGKLDDSTTTGTTLAELGYTGGNGTITLTKGDGTKKTIEVSQGTTVNSFINSLKEAGVNASYDDINKRIFVSSKDTGKDNDFTLTGGNVDGANALTKLGLNVKSDATDATYKTYMQYYGDGTQSGITAKVNEAIKAYQDAQTAYKTADAQNSNISAGYGYASAYAAMKNAFAKSKLDPAQQEQLTQLLQMSATDRAQSVMDSNGNIYKTEKTNDDGSVIYSYTDASGNKSYIQSETTDSVTKYYTATASEVKYNKITASDGNEYSEDENGLYVDKDGKKYFVDGSNLVETTGTKVNGSWEKTADGKTVAFEDSKKEEATKTVYTKGSDELSNAKSGTTAYTDLAKKAQDEMKLSDEDMSSYLSTLATNVSTVNTYENTADTTLEDSNEYSRKSIIDKVHKAYAQNAAQGVTDLTNTFAAAIATNKTTMNTSQKTMDNNQVLADIAAMEDGTEKDAAIASFVKQVQSAHDIANNTSIEYNTDARKIDGCDSEIYLNGIKYTGSSNSYSINGLNITAQVVTDTDGKASDANAISITTSTDTQGIYDKIKDFLSQYNSLINEITSLYNADSAKGYEPLTDDEKDAMSDTEVEKWEQKIKDSLLRRDDNLESLMSAMTSAMSGAVEVNGKKMYLSNFGIKTLGYLNAPKNQQNAYHIDGDEDDANSSGNADKLMTAITNDPDTVINFMQGLAENLYDSIHKKMQSSSLSSIYTVYNDKEMASEYSDYTSIIKKWEEKLQDKEDYYYKKFSSMETALSKLNSQTSSLSGLFGG
ncbi:flagellar filament capping protein FliD [Roseburia inulinivorans]|uniref:flagellar filament capping protein FliD n=1 Tax=Roseburia inulinivorans TaxID=360807 RepID=UPI001D13B79C|nr:flagellar filament capping protein FliD [Roseburia inulinivorans]MCC3341373.1 flagellar filament capping protein FliD [Roseburia inulinivorans DSM 16841]